MNARRILPTLVTATAAAFVVALIGLASGLLMAPSAHACNVNQACPDVPTPFDFNLNTVDVQEIYNPMFFQETLYDNLEFSVPSDPSETFVGTVLYRVGEYYGDNFNITVAQDISGNVPIGEQYNYFTFLNFPGLGNWGEVYNDIGVTPEAFLTTPFGDIDFPTAFVEAVGPTFFEPWASVGLY
jgi:hypothetical protein